MMRNLIVTLLIILGSACHATGARDSHTEVWRAMLFNGIKVGHVHAEREVLEGDVVLTRETMQIDTERDGVPLRVDSVFESRESKTGKPLSFRLTQRVSDQDSVIEGRIEGETLHLEKTVAGIRSASSQPYPSGALLPEGINLALVGSGMKPDSELRLLSFEPSLQEAVPVTTRFGARTLVELMDRDVSLIEVEQVIEYPGFSMQVRAAVDERFEPQRMSVPLLGMQIEMIRCDRACALAKNQSSDTLQQLLIKAPAFSARALRNDAEYRMRSRDGEPLVFPEFGEQRVTQRTPELWLHVDADSPSADALSPDERERHLAANEWLQSDVKALRDRAQALQIKDQPAATMAALTEFVREHITTKGLSVGYASALEAYQQRKGDCTEHALLLAALGRAAGIPTRVVNGFAFTDYYAGQARVFVPHAWTQAYLDGSWRSFDAALDGYDAGHIAIAVGNGDPARYYGAMAFLGNLEIVAARAPKASVSGSSR